MRLLAKEMAPFTLLCLWGCSSNGRLIHLYRHIEECAQLHSIIF